MDDRAGRPVMTDRDFPLRHARLLRGIHGIAVTVHLIRASMEDEGEHRELSALSRNRQKEKEDDAALSSLFAQAGIVVATFPITSLAKSSTERRETS